MSKEPQNPGLSEISDVTMCTCANLRKVTRAVTQAYDDALRPSGLRATQFTVLAVLARQGGAPLTQVAETLGMERTTLTRNLKPLVRRGLIRIDHEDDQRVRKVSLSEAGRRAFEDALPYWQQVQKHLSQKLGEERLSGFLADMSATILALQGK